VFFESSPDVFDLVERLTELAENGTPAVIGVVFTGKMGPLDNPAADEFTGVASRICRASHFAFDGDEFYGCPVQAP
jgi:hypothetical protein